MDQMSGDLQLSAYIPGATITTDDEWALFRVPWNAKITAVKWVPHAAVTADVTDYTDITVLNKASGAGTAVVATRSYAAVDSVAFTPESMTLGTAANLLVSANQLLTLTNVNTASGLALPDGHVRVTVRIR